MVRWEPYLFSSTPVASDGQVEAVARAWGVAHLPADFLAVAREHQGESPDPGALRVGGTPRTVECLLHFGDRPAAWSLAVVDAELRDRLPAGVHPVATSTTGTFWCLDLRGGGARVVHVDPDLEPDDEPDDEPGQALRVVAEDVTSFLDGLHDGAEGGG